MSSATNLLENRLIDFLFRGQTLTIGGSTATWSAAPTYYVALFTAAPSDTGGGTEVTGGSYARVAIASTLLNWAGTQGAGTTTASSGTSGTTSINGAVAFPTPSASWGTVTHFALFDAATSGDMIYQDALDTPKSVILGGGAPVFLPATLSVQIDN